MQSYLGLSNSLQTAQGGAGGWTYETEFPDTASWSGVSGAFAFSTDKVTFNIDTSGSNMNYDHASINDNAFVLQIPMLVGTATTSGTLGQMAFGLNSLAGNLATTQDGIGFGIRIGEGEGRYRTTWGNNASILANVNNTVETPSSSDDHGIQLIRTTSTNAELKIMDNTFTSTTETQNTTIDSTLVGLRYSFASTVNEGTTMQFDGSWTSWKMASGVTVAP